MEDYLSSVDLSSKAGKIGDGDLIMVSLLLQATTTIVQVLKNHELTLNSADTENYAKALRHLVVAYNDLKTNL